MIALARGAPDGDHHHAHAHAHAPVFVSGPAPVFVPHQPTRFFNQQVFAPAPVLAPTPVFAPAPVIAPQASVFVSAAPIQQQRPTGTFVFFGRPGVNFTNILRAFFCTNVTFTAFLYLKFDFKEF